MPNRILTKINEKQINAESKHGFDKNFVFEQAISSNVWTIRHNLNKRPSITIVDEYDRVVTPAEEYVSDNELIVKFNFAFKGKAYLN